MTEILNSKRGVGLEMIEALADLTGRSLDDLCGRSVAVCPGSLATHPRWKTARADAERMLAQVQPDLLAASLDRVGSFALPEQPIALTGLFVARLTEAVISNPLEFQPSKEKQQVLSLPMEQALALCDSSRYSFSVPATLTARTEKPMAQRFTFRTNLPALLRRLDANTTRTNATPYSLANLGREGRYATAADYGAYHAYQFGRADELAADMSAARYGCPDEAPPALPASDLSAAAAAHALYAARALREVA